MVCCTGHFINKVVYNPSNGTYTLAIMFFVVVAMPLAVVVAFGAGVLDISLLVLLFLYQIVSLISSCICNASWNLQIGL